MISRRILRVKAVHSLYAYFKSDGRDLKKHEKELFFSINKVYELYHLLLLLIIEIAREAEKRIDNAKNKKIPTYQDLHPNPRFINNRFIIQLFENESLDRFVREKKISWANHWEVVRKLLNMVNESDDFKHYMNSKEADYNADKRIVSKICSNIILTSEDLDQFLEEQSIYWNDDLEFCVSMVLKTIKKYNEKDSKSKPLLEMYKSPEDKTFIRDLFRKSIIQFEENKKMIDAHTKNWEVDRIAFMDIILLNLAITEIIHFQSIPIKVSFNEYIEISKYYSTKKSSVFINGVLDKIINELKRDNKIVKNGRGLME